jgi:hypothetical protein
MEALIKTTPLNHETKWIRTHTICETMSMLGPEEAQRSSVVFRGSLRIVLVS